MHTIKVRSSSAYTSKYEFDSTHTIAKHPTTIPKHTTTMADSEMTSTDLSVNLQSFLFSFFEKGQKEK